VRPAREQQKLLEDRMLGAASGDAAARALAGETMQLASKCGLGQSSPNAFVSILHHFQDEIMGRTLAH
jgi:NADH:ubiquinone oxidoreductase subunit F (NADH-binding)